MLLGTKCTWNVFLWKFNGSRLQAEESAGGTAIFNVRMEFFFPKGRNSSSQGSSLPEKSRNKCYYCPRIMRWEMRICGPAPEEAAAKEKILI